MDSTSQRIRAQVESIYAQAQLKLRRNFLKNILPTRREDCMSLLTEL
jgi:hypothetical protein